jgi:uncharacterized protein YbaP (TraB family)
MQNLLYASLLLSLYLTSLFAHPTFAGSSVWKVTSAKSSSQKAELYLGGTVHMLQPEDHPLPQAFDQAYASSIALFFETDLDKANDPAFQADMLRAFTFQDKRTLSSTLNSNTYDELKRFLATRGLTIALFETFTPAGLSLSLSVMELQQLGMNPRLGVDATFHAMAKADTKPTYALETIEEQLAFINSMNAEDPNKMIRYTIDDIERLPEMIQSMKTSWRAGDLKQLEKDGLDEMKLHFPDVYSTLIVKRNRAWLKKIKPLLKNDKTEFVLVGALHLAGEDGLVNALMQLGYKVEQQ